MSAYPKTNTVLRTDTLIGNFGAASNTALLTVSNLHVFHGIANLSNAVGALSNGVTFASNSVVNISNRLTGDLAAELLFLTNAIGGGGTGVAALSNQLFVAGSRTNTGTTNIVFLSTRTDGVDGIGTLHDPRDASTAEKFDGIVSNSVAGQALILLPGFYETYGTVQDSGTGPQLRSRSALIGLAGREATFLKLNAASPYPASGKTALVRIGSPSTDTTNATVRGITFDCNGAAPADTNNAISAVSGFGDFLTVENCTATGLRGRNGASECFAFYVINGVTNKAAIGGTAFRNCTVLNTTTDAGQLYISGFCINYNGQTNPIGTNIVQSFVEGCTVDFGPNPGGHGVSIFSRVTIRNNFIRGRTAAFYNDSWAVDGCVIENNQTDTPVGVWITRGTTVGTITNLVIRGNTFDVWDAGTSTFGVGVDGGAPALLRGVEISGNAFRYRGSTLRNWLTAYNLNGLRALHNTISGNMAANIDTATVTNAFTFNNRTLDGNLLVPFSAGTTNRETLTLDGYLTEVHKPVAQSTNIAFELGNFFSITNSGTTLLLNLIPRQAPGQAQVVNCEVFNNGSGAVTFTNAPTAYAGPIRWSGTNAVAAGLRSIVTFIHGGTNIFGAINSGFSTNF